MRRCARSSRCGVWTMPDLAWRPRSQLDRESIALYIGFELGNPEAALATLKKIDDVIDRLRRFPASGGRIVLDGLEHSDYRRAHANPYTIYYRFDEKMLTIYRIVHQCRDFDAYSLVDLSESKGDGGTKGCEA